MIAKRVGLFGDSQAEGLEPFLRSLLAERGMDLVWSEPRRGYTTSRYLPELAGAPDDLDLAIVVLGGNDTANASYETTLRGAAARFLELSPRVLWIGPSYSTNTDVEQRHAATRRVQARVLPKLGVTFRDPLNWQYGAAADRAPDGTHFRRDGYELQAEAVALEAQSLLARPLANVLGLVVAVGLGLLAWWNLRRR